MNKILNKITSIILMFIFMLCIINQVNAESENDTIYKNAREYFEENGILQKTVDNKDEQKITRIEYLKLILANTGYFPDPKVHIVPTPFKDVQPKSWYSPYINKAYRIGLIEKTEYFYPESLIRRIEAFKLILNLEGYTIPRLVDKKFDYKDIRSIDEIRIASKILDLGVYSPSSETFFGFNTFITRKEAIEIAYKFHLISEGNKSFIKYQEEQDINKNLPKSKLKNIEYLESIKDQIYSKYLRVNELNDEKLMENAIKGFVKGVGDKFTVYLPPRESKDFEDFLTGSFEGIGAYLEQTDEGVIIQSPIKGSPAELAGVQANDIINKVDGVEVINMNIQEVASRIKGPRLTTVEIEFIRKNKPITIKIVRDTINIPSVEYKVIDNILVISLHYFSARSSIEFSDLINENFNNNIKGVVLDLRSNPGGFLAVAEDILSYWIPEGEPTVKIIFRQYRQDKKSFKNQKLVGVKTAILQNNASASSSEIVSGTLKDYKAARIFGNTSFGKGTVQEVIQYGNGSSLKVTVAEWLTGKGSSINKTGVTADVVIEDNKETTNDEVIDAAIAWINEK